MASSDSNVDPDIAAAFAQSAAASSAPAAQVDPDIAAAFKAAPKVDPVVATNPYRGLPEDMNPEVTEGQGEQLKAAPGVLRQLAGGFLDASAKASGETEAQAAARTAKLGLGPTGNPIDQSVRMVGGLGALTPVPEGSAAAAPRTAEEVLAANAAKSQTNMGAAAASPSLVNVSPQLRQAISEAAQTTGGPVNTEALGRHLEADSLPVKIQLTQGQATQDPALLSNEVNSRAKNTALSDRYNDQNAQLGQNIQSLRDTLGPDVFSTNQVEHGDTLIQAYKDKDAAAQADISSKYQALKDANGGQFPVDAGQLLRNATSDLHQNLLFDHAPKAVMSTLGRLADNNSMTFENFESLRTNLARIQRSSQDGNEAAAAGVIRNAMEQLPLAPGAANLKPLADAARSAARTQFQAHDADPAYKAAVTDSVPADRFTSKFVINAPRDKVALMKQNLGDNDTAMQTIGVSALDHLRDQARIDPQGNGNFAAAGYNKALQAISPKIQSLVDPQTAESLQALGNVSRYVKGQPAGSFVNNSNTFTALAGEHVKSAIEGAANVATKGVPVATWIRRAAQSRAAAAQTRDALAPGAGLTKLSDLMQGPQP